MQVVFWSALMPLEARIVGARAPQAAGVYRLSRQPLGEPVSIVFYVGQATDLRHRFLEHLSVLEPNLPLRRTIQEETCYVRFATVASAEQRRGIERALYEHFAAKGELLNPEPPEGPAIDVNLT